ncbi:MAG: ABATE domain-containing protein [Myxococcales bacterium]|nr:CGNR zinc finger domain-containing protein [Myxococcales bacterium]
MGAFTDKFRFDLDGGRVSLDFVNTVSGMREIAPREKITDYRDLVYWAQQAGVLDKRRAAELYADAEQHPRKVETAFVEAIRTREALNAVVVAAVDEKPAPDWALERVDDWIAKSMQHRRLKARGAGRFELEFEDDGDPLFFLRPVAADAADVLANLLPTGRVRRCGESRFGRCGWFFLDGTRNASRRYCNMNECGNRAKQRRFQQRHR